MSYIKQDESGGGDTYTLRAAQSGPDVDIQLDAAAGADSDVKLKAGTNITLTEASDTVTIDAASGGSPGGSNGQIQYNNGGSFGGNAAMTFDDTAGAEQIVFEGTSSSNPLVRITQAGSGDALIVEDSTNPDSTQFKVTERGDVTIGTSSENIGKLRVDGTSGNRVLTDPSGTSNVVFRFSGPSSALEQLNLNSDNGNTMLYNPYVDGEYSFMRRDGVTNLITTSLVISTEDTIKLGLGGQNYGTAGQVLTSGGASGAASWTTVSGGGGAGEKTKNAGYITSDIAADSGYTGVSNWNLNINGTGTATGTPMAGISTSDALLFPFIVPVVPVDTQMKAIFRTGSTAGGDIAVGFYSSDSDGMPNGSPFFSSVFTPASFTNYTFNTGQLLSKGALIWFTIFGQSSATTFNVTPNSNGMFNYLPYLATSINQNAKPRSALKTTMSGANTFDSLSQSTVYDTTQVTTLIRLAMTF